ncbi:MAG: hypothetical protein RLZZ312_1522 [Bacteroidota bacterium]|jgi:hypothetical protein
MSKAEVKKIQRRSVKIIENNRLYVTAIFLTLFLTTILVVLDFMK